MKTIFENLSIHVEEENGVYRAFAFNAITENNVASCKCTREAGAVSGLFAELKNIALEEMKK